ncbi:MAG: peptide-methionine (S)-S-oxide reductase MsrA [Candidatus Paceibacterota bacterium]
MTETIVFGGGCFWCTEAVFNELRGVTSVEPGYAGGDTENPTYEEVSAGATGHAEAIQVEYDSEKIPLHDLLTVFFATHDPTTLNRQGNDVGSQYRSIILYTTEEQKEEAEKFIQEIDTSTTEGGSVVTELKELERFYPAEEYHTDYFKDHPEQTYCQLVISPKVQKVQKEFQKLLKEQ